MMTSNYLSLATQIRASALIELLQTAIENYGDLPVAAKDYGDGYEYLITSLFYTPPPLTKDSKVKYFLLG